MGSEMCIRDRSLAWCPPVLSGHYCSSDFLELVGGDSWALTDHGLWYCFSQEAFFHRSMRILMLVWLDVSGVLEF